MEQATEREWLIWFYRNADFGPADYNVRIHLKEWFVRDTGKQLPEGYEIVDDE